MVWKHIPLQERFDSSWLGEPNSGCWLWSRYLHPNGYAYLKLHPLDRGSFGGLRKIMAHRLSWTLHHGPISNKLYVCHKCDTPSCVRPDHLFLGTHADNQDDKVSKSRQAKGVTQWTAKVTDAIVREIRASNESIYSLSRKYSVGPQAVSDIRRGKTWKHVDAVSDYDAKAALSHPGSSHPMSKLKEADIPIIRARVAKGEFQHIVAKDYGVSSKLIGQVARRKIWRHVP